MNKYKFILSQQQYRVYYVLPMARSEMRNSAPKELITPHQFDVLHRIRKRELPPDPFILSNLEFTPDHPFFRNVCVGARVLATPEPSSLQY